MSVMRHSKTDSDSACQIITQYCGRLHSSVEAVSGVAEARDDVAVLVQPLVQLAEDDGDIPALGRLLEGGKTFVSLDFPDRVSDEIAAFAATRR